MNHPALFISVLLFIALMPPSVNAQDYATGATFVSRGETTFLQVTSQGTADKDKFNRVQACLMAKSAAEGLAKAEIAAELNRLHISKGKTIRDASAESEEVASIVEAYLRGVVVLRSDCVWVENEPLGTATAVIPLAGENSFLAEMYRTFPDIKSSWPEPASMKEALANLPQEEVWKADSYDGLIVDASSFQVKPDAHIDISSQKGIVAYSLKSVDPSVLVSDLMVGYANSEEYARSVLKQKGCSVPLVVKPLSVENGSEFIVSSEDAIRIITIHEKTDALKKARVMVVTG